MNKAKRGIYAAALTPIDADGEPDLLGLAAWCRSLLAAGCDGVAPLGTTGEGQSIAFPTRLRLPEVLARAGFRAEEVILATGATAIGDAVALTRAAAQHGFSNVLVIPPYYNKEPPLQGVYSFYARLIDSVADPNLRLYLYHFPQMSQVPLPVELAVRLRRAYGPMLAGLKDSSGEIANVAAFNDAISDFDVFPSGEGALRQVLSLGAAGVISATVNASAALARATADAAGEEAERLQVALAALRRTISRYPLVPALKQIRAWRSGDEGWLRLLPPLQPLTADARAALRQEFDQLEATAAREVAAA